MSEIDRKVILKKATGNRNSLDIRYVAIGVILVGGLFASLKANSDYAIWAPFQECLNRNYAYDTGVSRVSEDVLLDEENFSDPRTLKCYEEGQAAAGKSIPFSSFTQRFSWTNDDLSWRQ